VEQQRLVGIAPKSCSLENIFSDDPSISTYHRQGLNTLEYGCAVGSIFNETFMSKKEVRITNANINELGDLMIESLDFFKHWQEKSQATRATKLESDKFFCQW
jgi:hypothetical protein